MLEKNASFFQQPLSREKLSSLFAGMQLTAIDPLYSAAKGQVTSFFVSFASDEDATKALSARKAVLDQLKLKENVRGSLERLPLAPSEVAARFADSAHLLLFVNSAGREISNQQVHDIVDQAQKLIKQKRRHGTLQSDEPYAKGQWEVVERTDCELVVSLESGEEAEWVLRLQPYGGELFVLDPRQKEFLAHHWRAHVDRETGREVLPCEPGMAVDYQPP